MALTNRVRKLIKSLEQKKYRKETGLFVAEGLKIYQDLLQSDFEVEKVFVSENLVDEISVPFGVDMQVLTDQEFNTISLQKTPQGILALVKQKHWGWDAHTAASKDIVLVLDNIQDPGNMGTILRLADWFDVKGIIASTDTVDVYNPKVVQSSMGAIFRVPVIYEDLSKVLTTDLPVYGTFMDGENIYTADLELFGYVVMGNEAHGIRGAEEFVKRRLSIPSFKQGFHVESLNVAMACSIIVSEFRRRIL